MSIGEVLELVGIVLIVGGMLYAFYWILKYMLDGIKKHDD